MNVASAAKWMLAGAVIGCLSIGWPHEFHRNAGWRRWLGAAIAFLLGVGGLASVFVGVGGLASGFIASPTINIRAIMQLLADQAPCVLSGMH